MADQKTLLQKYVSDMIALEAHIYQAIDKQAKETEGDIKTHFTTFAQTLETHQSALATRLKALGGAANSPVKEGVAAVLGVAAGVIGRTDLFISGGAEHQGPDGGGPLAVIASLAPI